MMLGTLGPLASAPRTQPKQPAKVYEIIVYRGEQYVGTYQSNQQPTMNGAWVSFVESGTEEHFWFTNHVVSVRQKNAPIGEPHQTSSCLGGGNHRAESSVRQVTIFITVKPCSDPDGFAYEIENKLSVKLMANGPEKPPTHEFTTSVPEVEVELVLLKLRALAFVASARTK